MNLKMKYLKEKSAVFVKITQPFRIYLENNIMRLNLINF